MQDPVTYLKRIIDLSMASEPNCQVCEFGIMLDLCYIGIAERLTSVAREG